MENRRSPEWPPQPWAGRARIAGTLLALLVTGWGLTACTANQADRTPAPTPSEAQSTVPADVSGQTGAEHTPVVVPDVPIVQARPDTAPTADSGSTPTRLVIEERGVTIPVRPVGVQADGRMEIPYSSDEAGWYRFGPGVGATKGTAVIAGHVDSFETLALGPLAKLPETKKGDLVQVTGGDGGAEVDYRVVSVEKTSKEQIDWAGVFERGGEHRLVMVTCGGKWDRMARHYEDNIIVTAEPAPPTKGR